MKNGIPLDCSRRLDRYINASLTITSVLPLLQLVWRGGELLGSQHAMDNTAALDVIYTMAEVVLQHSSDSPAKICA